MSRTCTSSEDSHYYPRRFFLYPGSIGSVGHNIPYRPLTKLFGVFSGKSQEAVVIYDEVFALARRGLREREFGSGRTDELLAPIEARWDAKTTPSRWKRRQVRQRLDDGAALAAAIAETQRAYIRRAETNEPFAAWLE